MLEHIYNMLDSLSSPAILWNCIDNRIVHVNALGETLLADASGWSKSQGAHTSLRACQPLTQLFSLEERLVRPIVKAPMLLEDEQGLFLPLEGFLYYPHANLQDLGMGATLLIFLPISDLTSDIRRAIRAINFDVLHKNVDTDVRDPAFLRQIIDAFPGMVFIKDLQGKYLMCSEAFARFVGLPSPEDIIGKTSFDVLPHTSAEWATRLDNSLFDTCQPSSEVYPFALENNNYTNWQRVSRSPLRNAKGEMIGLVGALEDVGGVLALTEELTYAKARFLALSEVMAYNTFALILWDPANMTVNYISSNISYLGFKAGRFTHLSDWGNIVHPDDNSLFWDARQCLFDKSPSVDFWQEYRVVNSNGDVRWLHERISSVNVPGSLLYRSMFIDTTARHEQENITKHIHNQDVATASSITNMHSLHLLDIVSREYLQQLSDSVAQTLGVSSSIFDSSGVALTDGTGLCNLCRLIRETERGNTLCHLSDVNLGIAARDAGGLVVAPCETIGLYTAAAPITMGDLHLGTWIIGRTRAGYTIDESNVQSLAARLQLDTDAALEAFQAMPERDSNEIMQIFSLLTPYVKDISEFVQRSYLLMQDTEKMVKSQEAITQSTAMEALQSNLYHVFFRPSQNDTARFTEALSLISDYFGFNRALLLERRPRFYEVRAQWHQSQLSDFPEETVKLMDVKQILDICSTPNEIYQIHRDQMSDAWLQFSKNHEMENTLACTVESKGRQQALLQFMQAADRPPLSDTEVGFLTQMMGTISSFVLLKQAERKMQETSDSLQLILNNMQESIYVIDQKTYEVIFANSQFDGRAVTGSRGVSCFRLLGMETPCACCGLDMLQGQPVGYSYTYETSERAPGSWHSITMTVMQWLDERPVYLIAVRDITEEKIHQEQLMYAATFDMTLKIPTIGRLNSRLTQILEKKRTSGFLFLIEVDNLKLINNAYGHTYGDALMQEIVTFLSSRVPEGEFVYRYATNTFAVLYEEANEAQADIFVKAMYDRFKHSWRVKEKRCYSTFTAAMVPYPGENTDVIGIMRDADTALSMCFDRGRNSFYSLTKSIHTDHEEKLDLANDLHQMVGDGCKDLVVYYQPICDLHTNTIVWFEALMRWRHPTRGIIPPLKFIEIAEHTSLIQPLSEVLIREAAIQCKKWRDMGYDVGVNVNFSATHSRQEGIVPLIMSILQEVGLPPNRFGIEITENITNADRSFVDTFLRDMRNTGCMVAIDNFGTGLSSLGTLNTMPINVIKIDRNFVSDICNSAYDQALVSFIVKIATTLDLLVTCEGVETLEQCHKIRELGVDHVQGYYLSRPASASEMTPLLENPDKMIHLLS